MSKQEGLLWGLEDDETLAFDLGELIGQYVENAYDEDDPPQPGETLTVQAWRRNGPVTPDMVPRYVDVLESLLEALDEDSDIGGGREEPHEKTAAMKEAERAFLEAVCREYVPWACHRVPERDEVIDLHEWCRENMLEVLGGSDA